MTNVSVYGLGYIGLPTAAILAESGVQVTGIDIDERVVRMVADGLAPHRDEEGLDQLVATAVATGRLRATTDAVPADVHIITVGTPISSGNVPDVRQVISVARMIAGVIKPGDLVILESTVPPATCERVLAPLLRQLTGLDHLTDYGLAHCPERVIPGRVLEELRCNDRIIGGTTPDATRRCAALYGRFVKGELLLTDATTAEMSKLMENTYRDVNIALANELADIARTVGVDIDAAVGLANRHPRVHLHSPGIGVGGHCIPVDPWFLVDGHEQLAALIQTARQINDARPAIVAREVLALPRPNPRGRLVLLGLSYKADVDDLRESPAVAVAAQVARGVLDQVWVVEPYIDVLPPMLRELGNVQLVDLERAAREGNMFVQLVNHRQFRELGTLLPPGAAIVRANELLKRPQHDLSISEPG